MIGYIVYQEEDIKKNRWFIHELINQAKKYSINLKLTNFDEIRKITKYDFIINRSRKEIKILPNKKIFNKNFFVKISNDKWLTYKWLKSNNLPCLVTKKISEKNIDAEKIIFPVVFKTLNGHGGSEVFICNEKKEIKRKLVKFKDGIIQPLFGEPGRDIRTYILNKEIMITVLRENDKDFRSNINQGGEAKIIIPDKKINKIIEKVKLKLPNGFYSIDILFTNNKYVINEIEDAVGTRILYKLNINAAGKYMEFIYNTLKKHDD